MFLMIKATKFSYLKLQPSMSNNLFKRSLIDKSKSRKLEKSIMKSLIIKTDLYHKSMIDIRLIEILKDIPKKEIKMEDKLEKQ